jgi:hypothetical protein
MNPKEFPVLNETAKPYRVQLYVEPNYPGGLDVAELGAFLVDAPAVLSDTVMHDGCFNMSGAFRPAVTFEPGERGAWLAFQINDCDNPDEWYQAAKAAMNAGGWVVQ